MKKYTLIGLLTAVLLCGLGFINVTTAHAFPAYCHMYPAPANREVDEGTPWVIGGWGGIECSYEVSYAWVWTQLLMWSRTKERWVVQGTSATGQGRPFSHMVATTAYALCRFWGRKSTTRAWRVREWADIELANTDGSKVRVGPVNENNLLECIGQKS